MDEKTYVPSLTLNPTQAAAQEPPPLRSSLLKRKSPP